MSKKISFKNNQGTDIIKFDNIKLMFDNDLKRVVFDLYIDFEFFKAQTSLDAEEFDFLNMKKCLQKIYNKEWKSFVAFNPLEERFIMQIDLQGDGQIKVHSKLINPMYTGKLEFDFIMDPTTIPELIREIEAALEV